jgi:hypothetical protein
MDRWCEKVGQTRAELEHTTLPYHYRESALSAVFCTFGQELLIGIAFGYG